MVLVTGGSGFVGQHLVRHLSAQGQQVRALYNSHQPTGSLQTLPGIEWMQCDLLDVFAVEEAMQNVSDVYHCAAIVTFDAGMADKMLHFNPESTANIVNQAVEQGIRKMVYISSIAALGRSGGSNEISEEQEWGESRYNSAYGLSKYLAEGEVWRGIGEGLNAVIVNPSVILGAGDWSSGSPQIISLANKEFPFYTNGVNGWVDVSDVVKALTRLMASSCQSERYIVSCGNYSYRKIITLMAAELGKKPPAYHAGPFVTGIAWRLATLYSRITGRNALITRASSRTAHNVSHYNNSRLPEVLPGFSYTPIEETIRGMAQAFMQTHQSA